MSMIPSFRGAFDSTMSTKDCHAAVSLIKEIKGVASISFNEAAKTIIGSYTGNNVVEQIRQIDGLKLDTRHRF